MPDTSPSRTVQPGRASSPTRTCPGSFADCPAGPWAIGTYQSCTACGDAVYVLPQRGAVSSAHVVATAQQRGGGSDG